MTDSIDVQVKIVEQTFRLSHRGRCSHDSARASRVVRRGTEPNFMTKQLCLAQEKTNEILETANRARA